MPGSDFDFEFRWVPNTYQARIQRAAVLYPTMGIAHTARGISKKTGNLVRVWRARIAVLADAGWSPRKDNRGIVYARNCAPAFVYAVPTSRPCSLRGICPFCYARWVREIWMRVDGAFPYNRAATGAEEYLTLSRAAHGRQASNDLPRVHLPEEQESHMDGRRLRSIVLDDDDVHDMVFPYHLVEVHSRGFSPYVYDGMTGAALCRRVLTDLVAIRARRMRRIRALGSFVTTTVVPTPDGWRVRQHELHQVRPDYEIPVHPRSRVLRHTQPTRRHVFHAVVHVCRYPKMLLYGDAEQTALLMRCRQGHRDAVNPVPTVRLSATYGAFRSRS
jgi:hypothetical protein